MAKPVTIAVSFGEAEKGARDLVDTNMSGKQDRREVNYRAAAGDDEMCRLCDHYEGDDQSTEAPCELVGGEVEAGAVCDLFAPAGEGDTEGSEPSPFGGGEETRPDEHE